MGAQFVFEGPDSGVELGDDPHGGFGDRPVGVPNDGRGFELGAA